MKTENNFTNLDNYFKLYGEPYTMHKYEQHKFLMGNIKEFFKRTIIKDINKDRKKKDKIKIHLYEINNFDLNASALQLDEKSYAVVIRSGVFEIIHEQIGMNIEIFEEITEKYYEDLGETIGLYYLFVYVYLIGHELGHIMQGHHSLTSSSNISESENIFDIQNNNSHPLYDRYFLELDADLYAVSFLIKFIAELKIKNMIMENMENKDSAIYNPIEAIIEIAVSSIYIVHNLFAKKHNNKSNYPEPHIRTGFMIKHLKINLGNMINENEDSVIHLCEDQMKKMYELQKEYYLSAFNIDSFDKFDENIINVLKEHIEFYSKLVECEFNV